MRLTILIFGLFVFSSLYSQRRKEIVNSDYSAFIDPSRVYLFDNIRSRLHDLSSNRTLSFGFQKKISEKSFFQIPFTIPLSLSYKRGIYSSSKNSVMYYYYYSDVGIPAPDDTLHVSENFPYSSGIYHSVSAQNYRIKDLIFQTGISVKLYPIKRRYCSFFTQFLMITGIMNLYQFDYYHTLKKNSSSYKWRIESEAKNIRNDFRVFLRPEILMGFSTRFCKQVSLDLSLGVSPRILYHSKKLDQVYLRMNDENYRLIHKINKKTDVFNGYDQYDKTNYFNLLARFSIYYNFNWKKDE